MHYAVRAIHNEEFDHGYFAPRNRTLGR